MRKVLLSIVVLFFLTLIVVWMTKDPTSHFEISKPGMDSNSVYVSQMQNVTIGEHFKFQKEHTSGLLESWPQFRGSDYDNISKSPVKLISKLPENGDPVWSLDLGEGHAGAAIYQGLVYVLDYDEEDRADVLKCISLETGEELWRRWYDVSIKRNHGISRTVPAVTEDFIVSLGPKCHIMCMDRKSGDLLWTMDIAKEYGSEVPLWYTGQCPIIEDGVAIIAAGGSDLLLGIDCASGEVLWKTPNPNNWLMSHSSIVTYTYEGQKMFVYAAIGGICAVAADGEQRGEVLWQTNAWNHNVVAPTPVCMPDGKIFLTAGYGAGSMSLQIKKENQKWNVEVLDEYKPREGLASEQQTPIFFNGHLIGVQPKDAGSYRNQLVCVHPDDCKKVIWSSGKGHRYGLGPYMIADNKLFLLNDEGTLSVIEASAKRFKLLSEVKVLDGIDAWAPIALADGYMILRDSKRMICLNMKKS
jgi:outer membrane protein assembly factor BamB